MKLIAYLRVSTAGQVTDGLGLPVQERLIRTWARTAGHKITAVYRDEGVSGANGVSTREALPLVLADVRAGQADGVVVSSMDRLARMLTVQEAILGKIWQLGGKLFTADGGGEVTPDDPDDPMRTAMRQMSGVFAQLDRAMVVKRLRNGRAEKALQGGFAYGSPAFGQQARDHALVTDDREQVVIGRMSELRAAGASYRTIAETLNAEGLAPKRGDRWHAQTVSRVLARIAA